MIGKRKRGARAVASLVFALIAATTLAHAAPAQAAPAPRCSGKRATVVGTEKADVLRGTSHTDVFVGRGGGDRIVGGGGADVICGGGGNDKLFGRQGDDLLDGGAGTDSCVQGQGTGLKRSCEGPSYPLTASISGDGSGTISSSPEGISCGVQCVHEYPEGEDVTLSAAPAPGTSFDGWGESCTGAGVCTVRMTGPRSVTASFSVDPVVDGPVIPPVEPLILTVGRIGSGGGGVTSVPAGVNCGTVCTAGFVPGTTVTLTAAPEPGSAFGSWSGCDTLIATVCTVAMTSPKSVSVSFNLLSYELSLTRQGSGSGWVTSDPSGINCGVDCAASYDFGTLVILTQHVEPGSAFTGWSGGGCSGTGPCAVAVTAATSITATFIETVDLTVNRTGAGAGSVTSSPGGISCPSDCFESFEVGTVVTLTATPGSAALFSGWSGAGCSGVGACVVTMSAARTVTATFVKTFELTVSKSGAGTVTSAPSGINCGSDCSEAYAEDTLVTLTATPDLLHVFVAWGGACSGVLLPVCLVPMSSAQSVTASFL